MEVTRHSGQALGEGNASWWVSRRETAPSRAQHHTGSHHHRRLTPQPHPIPIPAPRSRTTRPEEGIGGAEEGTVTILTIPMLP